MDLDDLRPHLPAAPGLLLHHVTLTFDPLRGAQGLLAREGGGAPYTGGGATAADGVARPALPFFIPHLDLPE